MKKNLINTSIPFIVSLACIAIGYFANEVFTYNPNYAEYEFQTCHCILTGNDSKLTPQCREYIKFRLYKHAAFNLDQDFLSDRSYDFGPIDTNVLPMFNGKMFNYEYSQIYERAMKKHGK